MNITIIGIIVALIVVSVLTVVGIWLLKRDKTPSIPVQESNVVAGTDTTSKTIAVGEPYPGDYIAMEPVTEEVAGSIVYEPGTNTVDIDASLDGLIYDLGLIGQTVTAAV